MMHEVDDLVEQLLQLLGSLEHGFPADSVPEEVLVEVDKADSAHDLVHMWLPVSPAVFQPLVCGAVHFQLCSYSGKLNINTVQTKLPIYDHCWVQYIEKVWFGERRILYSEEKWKRNWMTSTKIKVVCQTDRNFEVLL